MMTNVLNNTSLKSGIRNFMIFAHLRDALKRYTK